MIRSYFGIERDPFSRENVGLLKQQQEIFDTLKVHCQQGGLCLVLGEPGTGKSVIKEAVFNHDPKRLITPTIGRTLHTYFNTLRILCKSFQIQHEGNDHRCEERIIEKAFQLNRNGKMVAPIIDDAHLLHIDCLRRLRLLFEEFPKNHNLILIAQTELLTRISLSINEDIKSRVTYSVLVPKLNPDDSRGFILSQLDRAGLGHNTFTDEAIDLIARSAEGVLRRLRNIALSAMLEAVRDQTKEVGIKQVNNVLMQPHWRKEYDLVQT